MRLKDETGTSRTEGLFITIFRFVVKRFYILILLAIAFGIGVYQGRYMFIGHMVKTALVQPLLIVPNYINSITVKPDKLYIDINFDDFQRLSYNRETAIERGRLLPDARDEIPGDITYEGKKYRADIRLKGDMSDHWLHPYKWSFRIDLKGDNAIRGMKTFSVQLPMTRGYLNDWLFHRLLKYNGIIGLRYEFLQVIVNGRDHGIYAIEEHFDKRLLEDNGRREGPIIRFDDYLYWFDTDRPDLNELFTTAPIDAFDTKLIEESEAAKQQFDSARNLLELFRRGKLITSQVFKVEELAKFFAILDLFGYHHSSNIANIRFYYDPIASRLEPIGYDNWKIQLLEDNGEEFESGLMLCEKYFNNPWYNLIFADEAFFDAYVKALRWVTRDGYLERFFSYIEPDLNEAKGVLYKSFPQYTFYKPDILIHNRGYIRRVLKSVHPTQMKPAQAIEAYVYEDNGDTILLDIGNIKSLPIQPGDLKMPDSTYYEPIKSYRLPSKIPGDQVEFMRCQYVKKKHQFSGRFSAPSTILYSVLPGFSPILEARIIPHPILDETFLDTDVFLQSPNFSEFQFISVYEEKKLIRFEAGRHVIDRDLRIPAGYRVQVRAYSLDLINGSKIISSSAITCVGSEKYYRRILSSDGTGQGIFVTDKGRQSAFRYVSFSNLKSPGTGSWPVTGALTFYENDVAIHDCLIENITAEDAVNIVRSHVEIKNCNFSGISADAIDGDYINGHIDRVIFKTIGNDALDLSGSNIKSRSLLIDGAGDKAISIGERSDVNINELEVRNSAIAVAAKDASRLYIDSAKLDNCELGITAYQKKPEYGSAWIEVAEIDTSQIRVPFLIADDSVLLLYGKEVPTTDRDVEALMYGNVFGKASTRD